MKRAFVLSLILLLLSGCGAGALTPASAPQPSPTATVASLPTSTRAPLLSSTPTLPPPTIAPTLPPPTIAPTFTPIPPSPTAAVAAWLARLNSFRAQAGLPPVVENAAWSAALRSHALYMVKTGNVEHTESDHASPFYTSEGSAAGEKSNVAAWSSADMADAAFVDLWMGGPFHGIAILDPQLQQVAFGSFRDPAAPGPMKAAAALDVLSGLARSRTAPAVRFPVTWPGDGQTVTLAAGAGSEYPDPLAACPADYAVPTGAPLYVLLGPGPAVTPPVQTATLKQGGSTIDLCVFDTTTFRGPDAFSTQLGRDILSARSAIILLPKHPLAPGGPYTATLTTNSQTYTWSFSVSPAPSP